MRQAKLYRYSLPMDSGVILREQKLTHRDGWIVELSEDGQTGLGEIAPLPGFSQETFEQAGIEAQSQLEQWVNGKDIDLEVCVPSVAFGLSAALMELAHTLPQTGNYRAAPLCSGDPDELIPILNNMQGTKVAKFKVGLYETIRDGMLVSLFLESIPDLTLRLDANKAWTLDKAKQFAKHISPSLRQRIAFVEEPCQTPGDSVSFAIDTGIAIAWDETLQAAIKEPGFSVKELTGVKALIIKPTLIGSFDKCIRLIDEARSHAIQVVISSSLESSIGLGQLARFAHWQVPAETPGLDTMQLFGAQLETPWPGCLLPVERLADQTLVWQSESVDS
ncbi:MULTISPECIES: o-succinylbenzoate synthase [Vibrio]|uniref:o-succinylbenzoate synthase n=1 Tax=Vibrio TaxID=662 RepID=UPI0004DCD381|nr:MULTISPECIES: o-succinylbenzoate synthase [Vibrio]KFA95838.1 O-succinylbenzoate synthase [Vibrio sp. ER1A]NOH30416.1 o-succinylbenzoate synthase [Vibrio mediterranei]NOI22578.1 o-succinylbenzoate synthase [Vibrio mediterranei]